jgi:hypothetical protein
MIKMFPPHFLFCKSRSAWSSLLFLYLRRFYLKNEDRNERLQEKEFWEANKDME